MTYLKRISEYTNGIFGISTTVLGGAGAIVTGENAARTLSGLAGISSGTRAELNQAVFESLTTSVIVPAIRLRREELLQKIMKKRTCPIDKYTVEGAVADAINYHGACSMDTGIDFAGKSIQTYDDIGMKKFYEIQALAKSGKPSASPSNGNSPKSGTPSGKLSKGDSNTPNSPSQEEAKCPL